MKTENCVIIFPSADTYVRSGKYSNENFSKESVIRFCNHPEKEDMYSRGYIKFDLADVPLDDIIKVTFRCRVKKDDELFLSSHKPVKMKLYEVPYDSWEEETLTFSNQPIEGNFVAEGEGLFLQREKAIDGADLTEYIKGKLKSGQTKISFVWDGSQINLQSALMSSSKNADKDELPRLCFEYEKINAFENYENFAPSYYGNNITPYDNAKYILENSTATYIDNNYKTSYAKQNDEEYDNLVEGKMRDEMEKHYSNRKTRLISSLKDFCPLSEQPPLSKYGGLLSKRVDNGTGFFRTAKIDGRWHIIDPEGYLFYSIGMNSVGQATTKATFEKIANEYNGSMSNFAQAHKKRIIEDCFNTAGGWSFMTRPVDYFENLSKYNNRINNYSLHINAFEGENLMPFVSLIPGVSIMYADTINGVLDGEAQLFEGGVPMVFNPDFESKCYEIIKDYVTPWKDNPYIIGWWTDNEINETLTLLDYALNLDPNNEKYVYTYAVAWEWMKKRTGKDDPDFYDVTDKLRDDFREFVYDRYHQVMKGALNKYAPNHLYFGARHFFLSYDSPGIFRAAERYCDVISYNLYCHWTPDIVDTWASWADKPIISTEWYANTTSVCGGYLVKSQEDRGKFYENYTLRLLEAPNVVGWHWFMINNYNNESNDSPLHESAKRINMNVYKLIEYFDNRRKSVKGEYDD